MVSIKHSLCAIGVAEVIVSLWVAQYSARQPGDTTQVINHNQGNLSPCAILPVIKLAASDPLTSFCVRENYVSRDSIGDLDEALKMFAT